MKKTKRSLYFTDNDIRKTLNNKIELLQKFITVKRM